METTQQSTGSKKPWAAYNIIERAERKIWSRVGSAFKNQDGSFNIFLDAYPVGGKVHIRPDDYRERFGADRAPLAAAASTEDVS